MTNTSQIFEQGVEFIQQKDPQSLNILLQTHCQLSALFGSKRSKPKTDSPHSFICQFRWWWPQFLVNFRMCRRAFRKRSLSWCQVYLRVLNTADSPMIKLLSHKFMLPTNIRTIAVLGKSRDLENWFDKKKLKPNATPPTKWLKDSSNPLHQRWQIQNHQLTDDRLITDAFRYAIRFGKNARLIFCWNRL